MRIVVFVGSPLDNQDAAEWIRLAKRMKKEKVNVDIVAFGDGTSDVLQQFIETLNGRDGNASHLVVVQQGTSTLSEALMASPVLQSEDGVPMAGGGFDFGIDPNDDPELALALRVSMEEQRSRQEAEVRTAAPETTAAPGKIKNCD
jgi:26S proteasome regulatory subunit N10